MDLKQTPTIGIFCALLLAGAHLTGQAQEPKRPPLRVPEVADNSAQLVPPGWRTDGELPKEGDLNGDGRPDAAFVISQGGVVAPGNGEFVVVKHVLVLALRGDDGKLHRSMVSDAAVLDGDEGGVFGDPFQDLSIERGAVVIMHYGGSRERWGFTHRYRSQNGQWTLIGLDIGYTDSTAPDNHFDQDINLSTGLVESSEKGDYGSRPGKSEISGSYYELEVPPVTRTPTIDGRIAEGEWPGYTVRLNEQGQIYRQRQLWHGANDLSAKLHAVWLGENLFLCAEVTDNEVTSSDAVRLLTRRGLIIKPGQSKMTAGKTGYVFEARYSLKSIARALKADDKYIVDNLEMVLDPSSVYGDSQGFQLPASIEVVDVDNSAAPKARSVLSTRLAGSPYPGAIRIFRKGTLVLVSDSEQ